MRIKREKRLGHKKMEKANGEITKVLVEEAPIIQVEKPKEQNEYLYVYGITNNKEINLDIEGLKGKPIRKINFRDLTVLTSFYPNLSSPVEEKEAMRHAEILNKIAEQNTIIPMAFGTILKDQKILEAILTKSYQEIKKSLELVKDRIELGIKLVKPQTEDIPIGVTKEILESLNNLSVKGFMGNKFSDRLLLNCSFLIEKNKFDEFSNKIAELEDSHKNLKFIYTGPWPPYSFINIKISGS